MTHPTPEQLGRLAVAVRERRVREGWTQDGLASRGGPSGRAVRDVEAARTAEPSQKLLAKLDLALRWPAGTAARVLDGSISDAELTLTGMPERTGAPLTIGELINPTNIPRNMLEELRAAASDRNVPPAELSDAELRQITTLDSLIERTLAQLEEPEPDTLRILELLRDFTDQRDRALERAGHAAKYRKADQ